MRGPVGLHATATIGYAFAMPETVTTDVIEDLEDYLEDELLVEEISIDGMCGVY